MFDKIKKSIVQNNSTTSKNFSYTKANVSLSFNLRTDIKQDLKDFKELLEVAILEVDKEIKTIPLNITKEELIKSFAGGGAN